MRSVMPCLALLCGCLAMPVLAQPYAAASNWGVLLNIQQPALEPGEQRFVDLASGQPALLALDASADVQLAFVGIDNVTRPATALPSRLCPTGLSCWVASEIDGQIGVQVENRGDQAFAGQLMTPVDVYQPPSLSAESLLIPDLATADLRRGDDATRVQRLSGLSPVLEVTGPATLSVSARLLFRGGERNDANSRRLQLRWFIDGQLHGGAEEALGLLRDPAWLDGEAVLASSALRQPLRLGPGTHQLQLESSQPAWLSLAQRGGDFIWPGNRASEVARRDAADTPWQSLLNQASALLHHYDVADAAGRLTQWLTVQAVRFEEWQEAQNWWRSSTFWDPLVAEQAGERRAVVLLRGHFTQEEGAPLALSQAELEAATLTPVVYQRLSQPLSFALTPTEAPTQLRLSVLDGWQGRLDVSTGTGSPYSITVGELQDVDWHASPGTVADLLQAGGQAPPVLAPSWRQQGLAESVERERASVVLTLPAGTPSVRIQADPSGAWVQLAIRDTLIARLPFAAIVEQVENHAGETQPWWRAQFRPESVNNTVPPGLRAHWKGLVEQVRGQLDRVKERLAPPATRPIPGQGDFAEPLQQLLREGSPEAVVRVAERLQQANEGFLLDRYLAYAMLRLSAPAQRRAARQWALAYYREQGRFEPLESLLYAQWLWRGDNEAANSLLAWLAWQGGFGDILRLWPALAANARCQESVLLAAWREREPSLLEYCRSRLDESAARLWSAHYRALVLPESAAQAYGEAGPEGAHWQSWRHAGAVLAQDLGRRELTPDSLRAWQLHRQSAPESGVFWQPVSAAAVQGGGQRKLFNDARRLDLDRLYVGDGDSITIQGQPEQRIRVEARVLQAAQYERRKGWKLHHADSALFSVEPGAAMSPSLRVMGNDDASVGVRQIAFIRLDAGGQARLSATGPWLLDLRREHLALDVSPLPDPSPQAWCWLSYESGGSEPLSSQSVALIGGDEAHSIRLNPKQWNLSSDRAQACQRAFAELADAPDSDPITSDPAAGDGPAWPSGGSWRRYEQFAATGGSERVAVPASAFLSPRLAMRAELAKPAEVSGARLLFGVQPRHVPLSSTSLRLCVDAPFFLTNSPVTVQIGEQATGMVPTCPQQLDLQLEADAEAISVQRLSGESYQFLRLASGGQSRFQRYHVARASQPLVLTAVGPSLIRIDEWHGDGGRHHSLWQVPPGQHQRVFRAGSAEKRLLRFFEWRDPTLAATSDEDNASLEHDLDEEATGSGEQSVSSEHVLPEPLARAPVHHRVRRRLPADGTNSAYASWRLRRFDDFENTPLLDGFLELGLERRRFEELSGWRRYTLAARVREAGATSLHGSGFWRRRLGASSWFVDAQTQLHAQSVGGDTLHHAYASASFNRQWRWFERWRSSVALAGFARHLGDPSVASTAVDLDVYSEYKADHRNGLRLSHTLIWDPFDDLTLRARVGATSNAMDSSFGLDNTRARLTAETQWREFGAELSWTMVRLASDDDRRRSSTLRRLGAELFAERWYGQWGRWELGLGLGYEMNQNDLSGELVLRWHGPSGRGLEDFLPWEQRFRSIREATHVR